MNANKVSIVAKEGLLNLNNHCPDKGHCEVCKQKHFSRMCEGKKDGAVLLEVNH